MATYKSEIIKMAYPAERVFGRLSNLEGLKNILANVPEDKIPADQKEMLEKVSVTSDSISFPGGPVGDITLKLTELKSPTLICLKGEGTPVPLDLSMHITPLTPDTCESYVEINLQIPAMLKPMVNGPMQKMTDQFAQMLRQMPME